MSSRTEQYAEYFTSRAPSAQGTRVHELWHRRILGLALRWVPQLASGHVLEVGAGWGHFGEQCQARGIRYEGIELNAAQAATLADGGLDVKAGAVPPYPSGPLVDVVWMSHVLEHATGYEHAREMVSGALERLRPGGALVVISPDLFSWRWEFWNVDWSHGFPTTARRVAQLMQDCGYEVALQRHHTATVGNPAGAAVLTLLFRLIPYKVLDRLALRLTGRPLVHSFMGLFGWRQIFVAGTKPGGAPTPGVFTSTRP